MYIYIYIYISVCIYIHIKIHVYIHVWEVPVWLSPSSFQEALTQIFIYMYLHINIHIYIYIYIWMHLYMYIHKYIVYVYIHKSVSARSFPPTFRSPLAESYHPCESVTSHMWHHTYQWVTSHICISHVTHMNESWHAFQWVMSDMNESCHTNVLFVMQRSWVKKYAYYTPRSDMSHIRVDLLEHVVRQPQGDNDP